MLRLTDEQIDKKIKRLKIQKENLKVILPFSVVEKVVRASGVSYREVDTFFYDDLSKFNVESSYANGKMTFIKSGNGLRMITVSHSQYVIIQKLLGEKRQESKKIDTQIIKLSENVFEEESENE